MNNLLNDHSEVEKFEKEMERISPFELKDRLIELADESIRKATHTMLNAGRGNPNWIATLPREALFALGKFGIEECRRNWQCPEGIAGTPQKAGIAERLQQFLKENKKDGSVEYNTYAYTFDKKAIYPYTGTSLMPFVQSGIPQIYASMGYLGKCTPYVLLEESQSGYTKFGDMTSDNIKIHNYFNLEGDPTMKMSYTALSNIYNSYSITFSK